MPRSSQPVGAMDDLLIELTRRYAEPHRHYHTIEHIADMLHRGRALSLTDDQVLAIWFHDAVYDVGSTTNEADSARLAVERLTACGYPEAGIRAVERMVLDTKAHEPTTEGSAIVIDLDLRSLASPPDQFVANRENLRREASWLSDEEFEAASRGFAAGVLARERIFSTEWGAAFEAAARRNLATLLPAD